MKCPFRRVIKVFWAAALLLLLFSPLLKADAENSTEAMKRAALLIKEEKFDEAMSILNHEINQNPGLLPAYINRGMLFYQRKEYKRALRDFEKALQLDPQSANGYQGKGMVLYKTESPDAAITMMSKAIELKPNFALAYYNRSMARRTLGDFKGALSDLNEADRLEYPVNPALRREIEQELSEQEQLIWEKVRQS